MNEIETLKSGAQKLGINLTDKQVNQFMKYMEILIEWNKKMNLTAIVEPIDIIQKHYLDCLTIIQMDSFKEDGKLVDIGTGAGFPGLPLKIAFPELKVTLIDSLQKRIRFLEAVVEELELEDVTCIHSRAEDIGNNRKYREKFDICASRAVAHLAILCEYCLPLVKVGGKFYSYKGQDIDKEKNESLQAIKTIGGKVTSLKDITIPYTDITHSIVEIDKVMSTPKRYPRKAGQPSRFPIGIKK